jgi:hypothetical protein
MSEVAALRANVVAAQADYDERLEAAPAFDRLVQTLGVVDTDWEV